MSELAKASLSAFQIRMVSHLKEVFAEECATLGDDALRDEIRYGMRRAEVHGFQSEYDICRYIDLMFALGSDFDANPDLSEIRDALHDPSIEDPTEHMDSVYQLGMEHLENS